MTDPATASTGRFFKSSYSSGGASAICVEVCLGVDIVSIRDSKWRGSAEEAGSRPIIRLSAVGWSAWLARLVSAGPDLGCPEVEVIHERSDGSVTLRSTTDGTTLWFYPEEWTAFILGVRAGEFDLTPVAAG